VKIYSPLLIIGALLLLVIPMAGSKKDGARAVGGIVLVLALILGMSLVFALIVTLR
jgi:hypothetical protein